MKLPGIIDFIPGLNTLHWIFLAGVAAALVGSGWWVGSLHADEELATAKKNYAEELARDQAKILDLQTRRQAGATTNIEEVAADVKRSEELRAAAEERLAKERQHSAELDRSLNATQRALLVQQRAFDAYSRGGKGKGGNGIPGTDTAACAAAEGRAAAIGLLLHESSGLLSEGIGFLAEAGRLLGEGGQVQSDLAAGAERWGASVRGWQAREREVVQLR